MDDIFQYSGREHTDPSISTHPSGTVHIFNLSLCINPQEALYMNSSETNHSYNPVPFLPLFVAPRIITKQQNPQLYMVVGPAHDLVAECTINSNDASTELDIGRVCSILDHKNHINGGLNPDLGDAYPITKVDFEPDKTILTIPNNNFCVGDVIQINKSKHTIKEKLDENISIGIVGKSEIAFDASAQLFFGDDNAELQDLECSTVTPTIKFMGIMGHVQPQQFHYFSGQVSIATIIRGPTSVLMTEKECALFLPGDPVYMHILNQTDTSAKVTYSCFKHHTEITLHSFLLGIFIVKKAHTQGALGYICLMPQPPPTFKINI